MSRPCSLSAVLGGALLLLSACDGPDTPKDSGDAIPRWYLTCGDPVCESYGGPFEGVPACTDQALDAECEDEGFTCDPQDACNALMICATEDPTQQTGGCPISRKRHKTDIHYLDAGQREAAAEALLSTRLATWRYHWDAPTMRPRLGFLIDDQEGSPAVAADGEHVDLYGYTSLAVAALQAEHQRLLEQGLRLDAQATRLDAQQVRLETEAARLDALAANLEDQARRLEQQVSRVDAQAAEIAALRAEAAADRPAVSKGRPE